MYATVFVCSVALGSCFAAMDNREHAGLAECESVFPALSEYAASKALEGAFPSSEDYYLHPCCSAKQPDPSEQPLCINDLEPI